MSCGGAPARVPRAGLVSKVKTGVPEGTTLFEEGDRGLVMYLVESGTVELRVGSQPVHRVEAGGFFGEMALLEEAPRSASAHAITDCKLMPIDRAKSPMSSAMMLFSRAYPA